MEDITALTHAPLTSKLSLYPDYTKAESETKIAINKKKKAEEITSKYKRVYKMHPFTANMEKKTLKSTALLKTFCFTHFKLFAHHLTPSPFYEF